MSLEENSDVFPFEDYAAQRKVRTSSGVVIPYKPVEQPAWAKHHNELPPKPQRFSKLHRWDERAFHLQTVVKWAFVAAGAATIAGPVLMRIGH